MDYRCIVLISNEVRCVLDIARQVSLAAQNAGLASRRAGNVRGFQAVALAVKMFSLELADAMDDMALQMLRITHGVSQQSRLQRFSGHFVRARDNGAQGTRVETALDALEQRRSGVQLALERQLEDLQASLRLSLRLCGNGRALARSATIEAAYGGQSEQLLKNAARSIEGTIEDIHARLKAIAARLQQTTGEQ